MAATLTTFDKVSENLQKLDEQPIAAEPTTTITDSPVASEPTTSAPIAEPTQPEEPQDVSSTSFDLGQFSEEPAPPSPTPTTPQQFNLDEEIKKIDRSELLRKAGVSDFAIELDSHIKGGGQAIDYLNARAIDYNKVSDDALLKDNLRKEYPTLTPSQIELMFNKRYISEIDASDEDKDFLQAQLQADAYKLRQQKIAEQQKFKVSDTPIPQKDEAYEQWKQNIQSQKELNEQVVNFYNGHDATKSLNESKKVTISLGEGIAPFNFSIDRPDMITKMFIDGGETWTKVTSTKSGEPDVQKQQLIGLFSYNPQKFIQEIFNYGQKMGVKKELVDEGQNAQRPQAVVANMTSDKATYKVAKFGG